MRWINEIIVHCTATRPEWMAGKPSAQKIAEIRRWHTSPPLNWRDIGYHYLIDRDGTVQTGRPLEQTGAHVRGKNTGTIGVALIGGHGSSETDRFAEHFTPEQDAALRKLIEELEVRFPAIHRVSGHNEYAAKACPGFTVRAWLAQGPQEAPRPDWTPPPAKPASDPQEAPAGFLAALVAFLAGMFGGKK